MLSERTTAVDGAVEVVGGSARTPNHLSLVGEAHLVWARTMALADRFEESDVFVVVLGLLRAARHDVVVLEDAVALGSAHLGEHPRDLVAWRAVGLLRRSLVFLGGDHAAAPQSGSRWTSSKEKAGRQMATYSAPSGSGVL